MKLQIVTPQKTLDSVDAIQIIAPGLVGEFGVLSGHKPFLAALGTGVASYLQGSETRRYMVSGGLCEVLEDQVVFLAEYAEASADIDRGEAQSQRTSLQRELDAMSAEDSRRAKLVAKLARAEARVEACG